MKKAISVLLCLCLALSVFTVVPFAASAAETTQESVGASSGTTGSCTWTLDNGVLTISGNGAMGNYQIYNDKAPLWRGNNITSVIINDGVTSIGYYAFYNCKNLKSVTIPDSVTRISSSAFYCCTGLTSVTLSNGVTSIGDDAFRNCTGLTSVTLPDSLTSIDNYAFDGCKSLKSVTIPDSVTSIGNYAFRDCTGLTSVHISDIAAWCNIAFSNVYSNPLYYAYNFYLNDVPVTDLIIPNSVTSIGDYAFKGCTGLTSVTIPDSVTSIDNEAFSGCTRLKSVTIGNSVKSIRWYAFFNCTSLYSVTIPDSVTFFGSYALGYYSSNYSNIKNRYFTIMGIKGSKAEQYAQNNGFDFISGEKICPHCNGLLSSEQVITFAATCTEDGERYWQCDQCGEVGEDVLPALGHDYIAVITPPTCTKGGYTTHTCSRCKDAYVSDEVTALGHDYQAVVTAPTCTKGGYTTHTCSHCKDAYVTDEVAALGHDYHRADVVPPNCTEQGYTPYTCSRCSEIKKEDIVDALGHDWNITVKRQPTETQQGVMAVDCQRCNLKKNVLLPVLSDQDYLLTSTATCTKAGVMTYTLKDMTYGVYSIEEQVPAKGHTVVIDSAVEANCFHDGLTEGSHCSVCGKVFVAQQKIYPSGTTGDCTWEKKGDLLIISGNGKMEDYAYNTAAPWRNSNITKVIIEDGVTNIGDYAFFECGKLVDVYIPQTVKTIGEEAFVDSGVNNLYIPSSVTSIGYMGVGYRRIHYAFGDIFSKVNGFTIYGNPNSEAKRYANEYSFDFIAQYQPPVVPTVDNTVGDADGDGKITISDVTAIQRYLADMLTFDPNQQFAADTNGDGKVDINDATHLQRYLAEFDVVLGKQN